MQASFSFYLNYSYRRFKALVANPFTRDTRASEKFQLDRYSFSPSILFSLSLVQGVSDPFLFLLIFPYFSIFFPFFPCFLFYSTEPQRQEGEGEGEGEMRERPREWGRGGEETNRWASHRTRRTATPGR
jgi:hypothetical protein